MNDPETLGMMFETMGIRDLRVFADAMNGDHGLVEIRIGGDKLIEHGTETLKNKIDTTWMEGPRFLIVLTGVVQYVCCRPDGLYVVTTGCLRE